MMSLNVVETTDPRFGHCILLENEGCQVWVTLDYGPRIVSARKNDGADLIYHALDPEFDKLHGHKMRITLERSTNGIYWDDTPVRYTPMSDGVSFMQTITDPVQLEISMDVVFDNDIGDFMVVHSCTNRSKDDVKVSLYTETPFHKDGFLFVPNSNIAESDRPAKILTLWDNAKWTDQRLILGDHFLFVVPRTDNITSQRLKAGSNNTAGWCGFTDGSAALIKRYVHNRTALYPFCHCSTYACEYQSHMSLQTCSPFYRISTGESARHIENWILPVSLEPLSAVREDSIDRFINSI